MLTIRRAQLDLLEKEQRANFHERLRRHLADCLPVKTDCVNLATLGMQQAQRFGFVREKDIAQFVELTARYVGGFALPVPALAILMAYGQDPELKLSLYRSWALSQPGVNKEPSWQMASAKPL